MNISEADDIIEINLNDGYQNDILETTGTIQNGASQFQPATYSDMAISHVIPEAANPLQCRYCQKSFTRVFYRKEHERIHTGQKPYECAICHKRFNSQSSCVKHERRHVKGGRFDCKICGKKCANPGTFRLHMKLHSMEKRFPCHLCGKAFGLETVLNKHMKFHQNGSADPKAHKEVLESCRFCILSFRSKDEKSVHEKSHYGIDVFVCNVCKQEFPSFVQLDEHMNLEHSKKPQQTTFYGSADDSVIQSSFRAKTTNRRDKTQRSSASPNDNVICTSNDTTGEPVLYINFPLKEEQVVDTGYQNTNVVRNDLNTTEEPPPTFTVALSSAQRSQSELRERKTENRRSQIRGSPSLVSSEKTQRGSNENRSMQNFQVEAATLDEMLTQRLLYECNHCDIIFRDYTMFLVHRTLHAFPDEPFKCHLCGKISSDKIDFNSHLIWHMN